MAGKRAGAERAGQSASRGAGGRAVREKLGVDFFREIGRKGGVAVRDSGTDMAELGRRGGKVTLQRLGSDHYRTIGRLGGSRGKGKPKPGAGRQTNRRTAG